MKKFYIMSLFLISLLVLLIDSTALYLVYNHLLESFFQLGKLTIYQAIGITFLLKLFTKKK